MAFSGGFGEVLSSLITNVLEYLDGLLLLLLNPWVLYTARNEGLVVLCSLRSGLVAIGVKLESLPVVHVVRLFLILSFFVSDVELMGISALAVQCSCFLGEF